MIQAHFSAFHPPSLVKIHLMSIFRLMRNHFFSFLTAGLTLCFMTLGLHAADVPKVGDKAVDFTLKGLANETVRLDKLTEKGTVVVVLLRGWPGYQCPVCDIQAHEFIAAAPEFAAAKAQLVFIYPGPAQDLKAHAQEFQGMKGKLWPREFLYALDPDYTMVNAYGLRWDAPRETAYPSTFVIDSKGVIQFAKISHSHGNRAKAAEVLAAVKAISGK